VSYLRHGKFEIIAHRGGGREGPENTIEAFQRAYDLYPDVIFELDVRRSHDGEIVVIHDETLDRTTDGKGKVSDLPWNELKELDAAHWFTKDGGKTYPLRGQDIGLSRFEEIFERFPSSRISVEFKTLVPFCGPKVIDTIRMHDAGDRVVLAGADHRNLVKASRLAPEMACGFSAREMKAAVMASTLGLSLLLPRRADVFQIPYDHGGRIVATPHFVSLAHGAGKSVHVWTVNDEATMRHLIRIGVDGIITDAPSLLWKVARELKVI